MSTSCCNTDTPEYFRTRDTSTRPRNRGDFAKSKFVLCDRARGLLDPTRIAKKSDHRFVCIPPSYRSDACLEASVPLRVKEEINTCTFHFLRCNRIRVMELPTLKGPGISRTVPG